MKTAAIGIFVVLLGMTCQAQTVKIPKNSPGRSNSVAKAQTPVPLKPGVYSAAPYTGLVLVPKAHFDERMAHEIKGDFGRMPVIKPDLRLNPILRKQ